MNIEERRERHRIARRKSINTAKEFVAAYLLEHHCIDCGERDLIVLTFDHIQGEKRDNIADMIRNGLSVDTIKDEIEKTEVVCFNCHTIREQTRSKTYRWQRINENKGQ